MEVVVIQATNLGQVSLLELKGVMPPPLVFLECSLVERTLFLFDRLVLQMFAWA
jgi:hypothetical protein